MQDGVFLEPLNKKILHEILKWILEGTHKSKENGKNGLDKQGASGYNEPTSNLSVRVLGQKQQIAAGFPMITYHYKRKWGISVCISGFLRLFCDGRGINGPEVGEGTQFMVYFRIVQQCCRTDLSDGVGAWTSGLVEHNLRKRGSFAFVVPAFCGKDAGDRRH